MVMLGCNYVCKVINCVHVFDVLLCSVVARDALKQQPQTYDANNRCGVWQTCARSRPFCANLHNHRPPPTPYTHQYITATTYANPLRFEHCVLERTRKYGSSHGFTTKITTAEQGANPRLVCGIFIIAWSGEAACLVRRSEVWYLRSIRSRRVTYHRRSRPTHKHDKC